MTVFDWLRLKLSGDPFARNDSRFLGWTRDDFLFALLQRRRTIDVRLKHENLNRWPMFKFRNSVEGAMLVAAEAAVRLAGPSLTPAEFSRRLDWAIGQGFKEAVPTAALNAYLQNRLPQWDADFCALGSTFLDRNTILCQLFAAHKFECYGTWPPTRWLQERIPWEEAMRTNGIEIVTSCMLPGDELWSYSSPPSSWKSMMGRRGVVLLRDGKAIADVLTRMN